MTLLSLCFIMIVFYYLCVLLSLYSGMARTTPKTVVAMFVFVTLVICITYNQDNKTVDHETKSLDHSDTTDKVQHLVNQLTSLVGRAGLLKIAQNQTKENCGKLYLYLNMWPTIGVGLVIIISYILPYNHC